MEVLILKGFELHVSEVLILRGLLSRVVILIDLKSFIISDLIKKRGIHGSVDSRRVRTRGGHGWVDLSG